MKKPNLSDLTLREKIGQTGMPGIGELREGIARNGGILGYFKEYPFTGFWCDHLVKAQDKPYKAPRDFAEHIKEVNKDLDVPLLVACDLEEGSDVAFGELHHISANMSVGAANSPELTYKRSYYYAKELRSFGVNWAFGPVFDMLNNFFDVMGPRCISDDWRTVSEHAANMVKGMQDAGVAACPKHFPGSGNDYRDPHFCSATNDFTREEWDATYGNIWRSARDAGALSYMISHMSFPAVDDSLTPLGAPTPATASKKILDILRRDMSYDGIIVTDAVCMKGVASAFEHEDVYIECFNAGNDVILFVHDDYIDIMEKAVLDGRVSMERLDESVRRILDFKERLGLFDDNAEIPELSEEEKRDFDSVNYEISKHALTIVTNSNGMIPFDKSRIRSALIIAFSPFEPFGESVKVMADRFAEYGISADIVPTIPGKAVLEDYSKKYDLIVYATFLAMGKPSGMPFFSQNLSTLFNSYSYGTEKSVAASFGAPSIYHNYFETAPAFINAYSSDEATMRAFVDGILGEFELVGRSPVDLKPSFSRRVKL